MAAISREHGRLIFRKMEREILRLSTGAKADRVHDFRTTNRRLQILLEQIVPTGGGNQKKLLKALNRIRRRAGKIRDLDVQLAALRSLKVPQEPRRKTQLVQRLLELRAKQEENLRKLLSKSAVRELRRRLRKADNAVNFKKAVDPLSIARRMMAEVRPSDSMSDDALHRCRLAVKGARYAAELAPPSAETQHFIEQLKRLQDSLGNWHDWRTLTDTAIGHLGEVNQSSLVAAVNNVTRAKFRRAADAVAAWAAGEAEHAQMPKGKRTRTAAKPAAAPMVGLAASAA